MAKGAGMLAPSLATMLVVLTTDAVVPPEVLQPALKTATGLRFERVDSDGCLSTNDTVLVMANGASGVIPTAQEFTEALTAAADEQGGLPGFGYRDSLFQPLLERVRSFGADRNNSRFVALTEDVNGAVGQVQTVEVQADELGETQP